MGKARTRPEILRIVLGPYVQYCLLKTSILEKRISKLDEKLPSYAKFNVHAPKWHLAYFLPIDGHFGQIVRYGLRICFTLYLQ